MLNWGHDCVPAESGARRWSGLNHSRAAVTKFRFQRDGLFLTGMICYALNRWLLKPVVPSSFLHSYFNDLWLIPCALPLVLWIQKWLGWRGNHAPTLGEIFGHLALWSVLFEAIGPKLTPHATGDLVDVLCYCFGGVFAWAWWHRHLPSPADRAGVSARRGPA